MIRENINNRAITAINYLLTEKLENKSTLASELGISASKFSEILGKRMKAGTDVLAGLSSEFGISSEWLLTGEGSMLEDDHMCENAPDPIINTPSAPREIHTSDPDFTYKDNDNAGKVPIITESGFANIGYEKLTNQQIEDYYYIKEFRNADFMLRMAGDTMYPKYKNGDLLACREITMQTFWQYGKVHAILTCNQGLIIRRVMPGDNDKVILMRADNPNYPDCRILLEEIVTSAIVIGSISMD